MDKFSPDGSYWIRTSGHRNQLARPFVCSRRRRLTTISLTASLSGDVGVW